MKENIQIIVTQHHNLRELGDVIYRSYSYLMRPAYNNRNLEDALPFITKANSDLVQSGKYYAATVNEKIIACGGWSFEKPGSGHIEDGIAHLRHFATLPEYAGKGIGASLYSYAEAEAKKEGVRKFECFSSLNAVKFYERVGLEVIKEENITLPGNIIFPCVLMRSVPRQDKLDK